MMAGRPPPDDPDPDTLGDAARRPCRAVAGPWRTSPVWAVVTLVAIFAAVVGWQVVDGAYGNEFGRHSDEAAHYITGLMVRDYALSPPWRHPMRYAEDYYLHYPKVALGHWPPFFYVVQAGWTALFGPSRASVLLLMAALTTLLAWTLGRVVAAESGAPAGLAWALVLVGLPIAQRMTSMLMAEILVALLAFWATLCFGRYVERGRRADAVAFGLLAALTLLTKANGLCLALVPPLTLLLTRRWDLLARPSFYAPAAIVVALCGPWYYLTLTPGLARNGVSEGSAGLASAARGLHYYSNLGLSIGYAAATLAAAGVVARVAWPRPPDRPRGHCAALAALVLGVLAVSCSVPVGLEARYLLAAVAPALALAAVGVRALAGLLPAWCGRPWSRCGPQAAATLLIAWEMIAPTPYRCGGFRLVALDLLADPTLSRCVFLVSSDEPGEGMFIAEVAGHERRPGHVVLRASKVLAKSKWDSSDYTPLYRTGDEVMDFLTTIPVDVVVVDTSILESSARLRQQPQLLQAIGEHPDRWTLIGSYPEVRGQGVQPDAIQVYRMTPDEARPRRPIRIDMSEVLGRSLQAEP
jgi:multisubunit Na+/H+ antiporter MnhF subunit